MGFFGMRLYLYQAPLFDRAYDSGMWLAWRYPFVPSEDGGRAMRFYSIPSGVSKPGRGVVVRCQRGVCVRIKRAAPILRSRLPLCGLFTFDYTGLPGSYAVRLKLSPYAGAACLHQTRISAAK